MQCFKFYDKFEVSLGYLDSTCTVASNSSYRVSPNITGYNQLIVKTSSSNTSAGILCTYNSDGTFTRSSLTKNSTVNLVPTLNHRISFPNSNGLNLYSDVCVASGTDKIYSNLNSISDTDIYNNINLMIPFFIILIIFSFSYMVLRRVIKSSSRGDVNI